jgi:hypothetical protein
MFDILKETIIYIRDKNSLFLIIFVIILLDSADFKN